MALSPPALTQCEQMRCLVSKPWVDSTVPVSSRSPFSAMPRLSGSRKEGRESEDLSKCHLVPLALHFRGGYVGSGKPTAVRGLRLNSNTCPFPVFSKVNLVEQQQK